MTVTTKHLSIANAIVVVSSLLSILACFLPFVSTSYEEVSLTDGLAGYAFIAFAIAISYFTLSNKNVYGIILSILNLVRVIYRIRYVVDKLDFYVDANVVEYRIGFYLIIISAITMVLTTTLKYIAYKEF